MFNEHKSAQIAAWFLDQSNGQMPHLKLMKLMYLAERESMRRYGFPMTGDRFVSMPHGPVLSYTLSHIDGYMKSCEGGWDSWISDKANHQVALAHRVDVEDLDELSPADIEVLQNTWQEFGWMDQWQIRDYTHDPDNVPEWQDPHGSSEPIPYRRVFEALGFRSDVAKAMVCEIEAQDSIERSLRA